MRRRISLYIDGTLADIAGQDLVLFNYAFTEAQNPTIVKNSYSKRITLPGTPTNNAIFGHFARPDRRVADTSGGAAFNPGQRTPFTIFQETGEVLESGYLRLEGVTRQGQVVTGYEVTLFGGLGDFFYCLERKADGEKMTLADLRYRLGISPLPPIADELDFTITASYVKTAWSALIAGQATGTPAGIINFVPAYEGTPEGDFDAGKAVASCAAVGLPASRTNDQGTFTSLDGGTILNLAAPVDEWAAKDLRCYLQRPALSVSALMTAIANSGNNGGFSVDWTAVQAQVADLWLTLPLLSSLSSIRQVTASYTLASQGGTHSSGSLVNRWNAPSSAVVAAMTECAITASVKSANSYAGMGTATWYLGKTPTYDSGTGYWTEIRSVWFLQFVAYSAGGQVVGGSKIQACFTPTGNSRATETPEQLANVCGYVPRFATDYETASLFTREQSSGTVTWGPWSAEVSARGASYVVCYLDAYMVTDRYMNNSTTIIYDQALAGGCRPYLLDGNDVKHQASSQIPTAATATMETSTPSQARSGATIKKADVLSTKASPAQYLLSLAKTFGWVFVYDRAEKAVTILPRNAFFGTGEDVVDLTDRVDVGREVVVGPQAIASKWYDFEVEGVGGAFTEQYLATWGVPFGRQRVDTGYDFDAEPVNLLEGNVLRQAASVLQSSKYWNVITRGADFIPSPFVDSGHTYTLWAPNGTSSDFPVSQPPATAQVAYYNPGLKGYDIADKLQLHDADGKGTAGDNVLVWFTGSATYDRFKVSDDSTLMVLLNDGRPCWDLNPGAGQAVPVFSRYRIEDGEVTASLEYGDTREVGVPDVTLGSASSIYAKYWRAFLRDRLDKDTKVLRCRVDFRGLPVGAELLRRFYWFEGSLWVLNKIVNYSLTTWDPVECEFVQVQETANYTNGQTIND